jgi:hypothetical protein
MDNIKMDVRGIGWGGMDWIDLAWDKDWWRAVVNMIMKLAASQEVLSHVELI